MASVVYNRAKLNLGNGVVQWDNGGHTYRILLVSSLYTVDVDHNFVSDVVAFEIVGAGYSRQDLAGRTATEDDALDRADFAADNPSWTFATPLTPSGAVIYKFVTTDLDSPLVCFVDFPDQLGVQGVFTLRFNGTSPSGTVFRGV